jgi:hypothetical protein
MLFRQRFVVVNEISMARIFRALLEALAPGRWDVAAGEGEAPIEPSAGFRYRRRLSGGTRYGHVIECLRPVSLILVETYFQGRYKRRVRLRFRVQPVGEQTRLLLDAAIEFNAAALVRKRRSLRRVSRECEALLQSMQAKIVASRDCQGGKTGVAGHNKGKSNIVTTKITTVNGRPVLR